MGLESLPDRLSANSDVYPGLTLESFLFGALQKNAIGQINAQRLQASGLAESHNMHSRVKEGLQQAAAVEDTDHKDRPELIAPALRVIGDFAIGDEVYVQTAPKSPWQLLQVLALSEADQRLCLNCGKDCVLPEEGILVVKSRDHMWPNIGPASIGVFAKNDYETLLPLPKGLRRPSGTLIPAKFAMGLSAYDKETTKSDITSIFRNFDLPLDTKTFKPN